MGISLGDAMHHIAELIKLDLPIVVFIDIEQYLS